MEAYTLINGVTIPKIGFGTWQIPEGAEAYQSVSYALEVGYTHIDTAQIYGNEVSVGKAIADSNLKRQDIFLTTKFCKFQPYRQSISSVYAQYSSPQHNHIQDSWGYPQ